MNPREELDARLRVMSLVWLALTGGVVTVAAVVYGLLTMGGVAVDGLPPSMMMAIAPAFMLMMVGGIFLGHRLEGRIRGDAEERDKIDAYFAARIVAMALQEGPALAVIVFSLLTGTPNWTIAAAALGVWTMFLARPKRGDVERLLRP